MGNINRRRFLTQSATALGGVAAGTALGLPALSQSRTRIRFGWWGNPDRDRRTFEAMDIFNAKNPDIEVTGETASYNDYFTRLATQSAGGNLPDCLQMGAPLPEFQSRGAVVPLDPYLGSTIDVSDVDQSAIDANTIDGQLYALSLGANSQVTLFNTQMVENAGEDFDPFEWTYEDFMRVTTAISKSTPDGVYGTDDLTSQWLEFDVWLRQHGKQGNFTADGKALTFDVADLVEYWSFWKDMRDAGACPPGAESAGEVGSVDMGRTGVVTGKTAMSYAWSNQIVGFQSLMSVPVGAAMYPRLDGGQPGQYVKPSQSISLSRDAGDPEIATRFINAILHDEDIVKVLGMERGIPQVAGTRELLQPSLTEPEQLALSYFSSAQTRVAPLPAPFPPSNREIWDTFVRLSVNVLLERQSMEDTASDFIRQAESILRRA